ncbi:MAG: sulfatase-like hydrolase/transferase [Terracidiphilus sp.]|jgi:hypothetical protein
MIKRISQAWGFAAILLLPGYVDLTSSLGDERMHVSWPLTHMALAQIVDMAIVALIFAGLMAILRKLKSWARIRWFVLALLPIYLLLCSLRIFPFRVPYTALTAASVAWIAALALLVFRAPSIASKFYGLASAVLTGAAVFGLVMTVQLVRAALWRPGPQAFATSIPAQPATRPRLVWIVFDELAYKPTFEARDPSLDLPNFDRLRRQSALYTDVTPIGYHTNLVVPGLLTGHLVTSATFTSDNQYLIRTPDSTHWQPFDVSASIFGLAKQRGVTSSIVGWYLAYCPIFAGTATECYWSNDDTEDGAPPSLDASFAEEVWYPLRIVAEQLLAPRVAVADVVLWESQSHMATVKDLSQHALATLADSQADIIYLHLPAPHPPNFWDRHTHTFAVGGSYIDSLDYSDALLGQMLDILEAQPRWKETSLVVQGDHSWRTRLWRTTPGWSAGDERFSHGGEWDPRPLMIIHSAGQTEAETVTAPTSLMLVHDFALSQIETISR